LHKLWGNDKKVPNSPFWLKFDNDLKDRQQICEAFLSSCRKVWRGIPGSLMTYNTVFTIQKNSNWTKDIPILLLDIIILKSCQTKPKCLKMFILQKGQFLKMFTYGKGSYGITSQLR